MFRYNDSESRIKLHGSQLNYPILPLEPASNFNAKKFNKIRVIRTSLNTFRHHASNSHAFQSIVVRELQVWIYKDNLLTNVALNKQTLASSTHSSYYPSYEANNGIINKTNTHSWYFEDVKIGDNLIIETGEYDLSDLASIVFYEGANTDWGSHECHQGVSIQLLHD